MYHNPQRHAKQTSWRRQCVEMLCCLLGLIWVGNPNFHSFSHIVDLPHQHPTGSIYSHSPTTESSSLFFGNREYYSHGPFFIEDEQRSSRSDLGDSFAGIHESLPSNQELSKGSPLGQEDAAERATESDPEPPCREPSDSDAPFFFMHLLEIEACCSAPYEVFLEQAVPVLDEPNFESSGFFSSAELGTIGARGPPISMATRYLPLI